ncbi:MAG: hypothetical protein SNJ55_01215 [Chloroherpetonaceae bacterium]
MGSIVLLLSSMMIAGVALFFFYRAFKSKHFESLQKDALIPFDDDEPVGKPTDQLFKDSEKQT